ncbi:MAG: bifunctional folylpolyglutamate synthase/dihydrofolate synthase [Planctomycetes bacterium]|nr:bifunctional folylpolyglutamate synthase/dihydrofolate synthase [Planctomycetota bacterium]
MPQDTYESALRYLFSSTDYERMRRVRYNADTFSLDRMRRLLDLLGRPHEKFPSVHVAGTKGKGSTAAMVHAMAVEAGLRAGLYTSPHLADVRERIRVGREDISREDLARLIQAARPHAERLRAEGDPATFFEIFTALAFAHFARVRADLVAAEVGLGGRLDATNVLVPEVSVITAVSFDHTEQLGRTLAAIAGEKAGIVKPGVPAVSQPQDAEAMAVIEAAARRAGSPLVLVGRDVTYSWRPDAEAGRMGGRLSVRTPLRTYDDLFIPLMGEHQALNACAAVAAAERSGPLAARLTPDLARRGLAAVSWPGRMELLAGQPDVLLDGAHNRASMERLLEGLRRHFPGRPLVFIFASAADKDVDGMLEVLAGAAGCAGVVLTRTDNPRAADPADLAARLARLGRIAAGTAADARAALRTAAGLAPPDALLVVTGSLYLVGEVRRTIQRNL